MRHNAGDAAPASHGRRPPGGPPRRPGQPGRRPARTPVPRVPRHHRRRPRGEGRRPADRRRPVRFEHAAAALRGARRGRAQAAHRCRDPGGDHPRHARRLRRSVRVPGLRPGRARRPGARLRPAGGAHPRPAGRRLRHPGPRGPRVRLPDQAGAPQPAGGVQRRRRRPRALARRDDPRVPRDPRQDRRGRGRVHGGGGRGLAPRLPRPRALALDAAWPGRRDHVGVQRRARARGRRPGSRRQRPARGARRAQRGASRGGGGTPGGADAVRPAGDRRGNAGQPARPRGAARRPCRSRPRPRRQARRRPARGPGCRG